MLLLDDRNKVVSINAKRPSDIKFERIYCPDGLENPILQTALVVNLLQDMDIIFRSIHKKSQYKIRRCINGDHPIIEINFSPSVLDVENFIEYYKSFVKDKNSEVLYGTIESLSQKLFLYQKAGIIAISSAYSELYPESKVFHLYLLNKIDKNVRLLCSISLFRNEASLVKSIIGRMNRLLHFRDIETFKQAGYILYDFGGIDLEAKSQEAKNIADFKMQLSNKVLKYYYSENQAMKPKWGGGAPLFKLWKAFEQSKGKAYIAIIYDENTYDTAVEIVNQLASEFNFYLFSKHAYSRKFRKLFDFVHDLSETYEKCVYYKENAYVPYEYFYAKYREGKIKFCSIDNIDSQADITCYDTGNLCVFFNEYDVFISLDASKLLEAIASGCFVITISNKYSNEIIKDKINGYLLNSIEELDGALQWCVNNLKKIRENAFTNSKNIESNYSYYVVAAKYRSFYNSIKF